MIPVTLCTIKSRSSHRMCSVRKGVLRNFSTFTGKHLCQGPFFNKVRPQPATLLKKRLAQVFSCEFWEIFKNTFFIKQLWATASFHGNYYVESPANSYFRSHNNFNQFFSILLIGTGGTRWQQGQGSGNTWKICKNCSFFDK